MATVNCFDELKVWKMASEFCKDIFRITNYNSFSKDYKLSRQIKGSCEQTRSQLYLTLDSTHITEDEFILLRKNTILLSKAIISQINYIKTPALKEHKYK